MSLIFPTFLISKLSWSDFPSGEVLEIKLGIFTHRLKNSSSLLSTSSNNNFTSLLNSDALSNNSSFSFSLAFAICLPNSFC